MDRSTNTIWGVVLVLVGFAISVVGLRFAYPVSFVIDLVGLGVTLFGYVIFRAGRSRTRARRARE